MDEVAPQDPLFDSSDGLSDDENDWDRSRFAQNRNIGKRQVESLIARQAEDRSLSKRNARKLTFVSGAPNSQAAMLAVERTWDAFFEGLGMDKNTCPTGEQIFRYIDTMTRHVKPGVAGKHAPSLTVIQGIWFRLIKLLNFRYRDLAANYGSTDVTRINVHLDQLVKRDLLVKGKWFKKQWLGFTMIQQMAQNWLECSLADGCLSWDRVLLKLLSIILQSALTARSGDIARSKRYTGLQCLCYQDIELTLPPQTEGGKLSVNQLSGKFTLRFRKSRKDKLNDDDTIFIEPIEDKSLHAVCVIKILLVVALRFGQVYGKTLREIMLHTAKRADRTVQWTHPHRPVICEMPRGSAVLTLDKPAPEAQLGRTLKEFALAYGILDRVTSHAVRRGAMRDVAYLKKFVAGVSTAVSAVTGAHSKVAENRGLTREYVGALQNDTYNMRAEHKFQDKLAPKIAASPMVMRRNTTAEIDAYMEKHGLNKSDLKQRATAGDRLRGMQIDAWREAEKNREVSDTTSDPNSKPPAAKSEIGRGKTLIILQRKKNAVPITTIAPLREATSSERNIAQGQLQVATSSDQVEKYFSDIPIDPQLLALDNNDAEVDECQFRLLESLVFDGCEEDGQSTEQTSTADAELWDSDTISDTLIEAHLSQSQSAGNLSPLGLEPDDFINWFAAINVFKLSASFKQNDPDEAAKYVPTGNSRDPPTPFSFYCGIGQCEYKTWKYAALEVHQISCNGGKSVEKHFSCNQHDIPHQFLTEESLRTHVQKYHNWKPRPCNRCPDAPDVLYYDINEWKRHQMKAHDDFEESIYCPLRHQQDCNNTETLYENFSTIRQHLINVHKQSSEQIRVFLPAKERVAPQKQDFDCPIEDCGHKNSQCNRDLRLHLQRKHHKTEGEALELVPLSEKEKARKEKQVSKADKPAKENWSCPVDECDSEGTFSANRERRNHLKRIHKWTEKEALEFVPLSKAEIGRENARQKKAKTE